MHTWCKVDAYLMHSWSMLKAYLKHSWSIPLILLTILGPNVLVLKKVVRTNKQTNGVIDHVPSWAVFAAKSEHYVLPAKPRGSAHTSLRQWYQNKEIGISFDFIP